MTINSATLLAHFGLTPESLPQLAGEAAYVAAQLPHAVSGESLDTSEQQRAMAYGNRVTAQQFIASRVLLRAVLSHYLCCTPDSIAYAVQKHGKPILAAPHSGQLHFSLSRRDSWCAIALSRHQPVGVDIEQMRELPEMDDIAALYFSTQECKALNQLHGSTKQRRFFELWTALEAIGKRLGSGLTEAAVEAGKNQGAQVSLDCLNTKWLVAVAS
ncbi:MAG: 4'-phosphopantetheinyl transferase family protein [Sulfuriferula sp.]